MNDFIIRTEELEEDQLKELYVESEDDKKIGEWENHFFLKYLKCSCLRILKRIESFRFFLLLGVLL